MIHFTLTPDEANLVLRSVIHTARCSLSSMKYAGENRHVFQSVASRIELACAASDLRQSEPATPRIEEEVTRGGVELCPRIS